MNTWVSILYRIKLQMHPEVPLRSLESLFIINSYSDIKFQTFQLFIKQIVEIIVSVMLCNTIKCLIIQKRK